MNLETAAERAPRKGRTFGPFRRSLLLVAVTLALGLNSTAFADDTVSVTLSPVNNSGVTGTAQLIARGSQTEVIVAENGEPTGASEPVHIHEGPCDSLNPKPAFPLQNVENGKSDTIVNAPLSSLANGRYVINVHQSAANVGTYVACGPIPGWLSPPSEAVGTAETSMPSKRNSLGAAVAPDGSIYAIVGSEYPALVERYDLEKETWTTAASLPTARFDLGVVAAPDGKIYAIGGCCGRDALATVEAFDPATNTWTVRADMPTPRRSLSVALASNGKIYAIGGSTDGKEYLNTVEEYDPATNTWAKRASMPTARGELGVVATSDGKIFAIGGITNDRKYLATVEEYDVASDTWTTKVSMPTPRGSLGVVLERSGKILAIGGANTGHEEMATVEEYNPPSNTWTTLAHLTTARSGFATAVTRDGAVYVIGGCCDSDGNYLSTVEVGTIVTSPAPPATTQPSPAASPTAAPTATAAPTSAAQSTSQQRAMPAAVLTAAAPDLTRSVVAKAAIGNVSSVPLMVIIPAVAFVTIIVVAAIVAVVIARTRQSASPAPSEVVSPAPSESAEASAPEPEPALSAARSTPSPSPAPEASTSNGSPSDPLPASPNSPTPPPSWAPAPVPSPWPPPFAHSSSALPTIFEWNGGKQVGSDGLPVGYQVIGAPKIGNMASVFKAYQPSLERYVALKVMSPTLTNDPVFVQRFYEEARRTAQLEHPNIVPIYDVGQTPNGALFIAMRYVDGLSLHELLSLGRPLDLSLAARIAIQVADALDHAHASAIIHYDVKPSNVMIESGEQVSLMDFGIAKLIGDSHLARDGAIVGSPKYLSPEQATGKPGDHRSDIYSLGVVFYEMLTGRPPFEANTPTAMLRAHTSLPPPPPAELNRQIPPVVAAVALKALAKSPAARYQSAREFGQAMRAAISVPADEV